LLVLITNKQKETKVPRKHKTKPKPINSEHAARKKMQKTKQERKMRTQHNYVVKPI